tara:strand:- start:3054 stop:3269 length:216 start_codon:yes stop_codon:yes gene_type:complete
MLVEIKAPVFKCEDDRNIFLSRLVELPGFVGVKAQGLDLHLTLTADPAELDIQSLQEICDFWGTTFLELRQ